MVPMSDYAVVPDLSYECSCIPERIGSQAHSAGCIVANQARVMQYAIAHGGTMPLIAELPDDLVQPWKDVAANHPKEGPPGIRYERLNPGARYGDRTIHALLHRNRKGRLTGVLYYYPEAVAHYVPAGAVHMWVDPARQGRGVGRVLAVEAIRRWPINLGVQRYTERGLAMARVALAARAAIEGRYLELAAIESTPHAEVDVEVDGVTST